MTFILPLPKVILECTKAIVLPQLSSKDRLLKAKPKYFTNGPKLFDCFNPLIGNGGELLISPFLGHVGICTVLDQVLLQVNKQFKLNFFGTCGGFDNGTLAVGSIVSPSSFYIEEKLDDITTVEIGTSSNSILSSPFVSSETNAKFCSLYNDFNISLLDMEVSFIKRVSLNYGTQLTAHLIISDLWDSSLIPPTPKALKSLQGYSDFLDLIVQACS